MREDRFTLWIGYLVVRGDGEVDVIGHGWDVAFGVAVPAEA